MKHRRAAEDQADLIGDTVLFDDIDNALGGGERGSQRFLAEDGNAGLCGEGHEPLVFAGPGAHVDGIAVLDDFFG